MSSIDMLVKASSNLNCRDKSVKVLQYGSRMILGFYSKILQDKSVNNLQLLLSTCILGRRSFRLFRSINHIQMLVVKLEKLSHKNFFLSIQDRIYVVECIEAFEQLCWALFFLFDNIIFAIKMGILDLKAQKYEGLFFPCWFLADASMFVKTSISLYANMQTRKMIRENVNESDNLHNCLDSVNNKKKNVSFQVGNSPEYIISKMATTDDSDENNDNGENSNGVSFSNGSMSEDVVVVGETRNGLFSSIGSRSSASEDMIASDPKGFMTSVSSEEIFETDKTLSGGINLDGTDPASTSHVFEHKNGVMESEIAQESTTGTTKISQKKTMNIYDFQNTTIEKVLSSNTNLRKILSTDIMAEAVSTHSEFIPENGVVKSTSESPSIEKVELNGHRNGSQFGATEAPVVSREMTFITDTSGRYSTGHGNEINGERTSDTNCTDDISDLDVNTVHGCQQTESGNSSFSGTTSLEKMNSLEKEDRALYWKLVKSIIDMGVSASFNPQLPVKKVLGEGGLGVLGVISASMAIYEEIKK